MDPAAAVLHYAQEIFEGMKAYARPMAARRCSGRSENARRFKQSAERLAMPELPEELFLEAVDQLVSIDRDWIPDGRRQPLHAALHVRQRGLPRREARRRTTCSCVIASSVGAYFKGGAPAVSIWVSQDYTRAAPGGTGAAKCGGNYAASLLAAGRGDARTAATRSCSSTPSSAAGSRSWAA